MVPICNYLAFSVFFLSPCISGFLPSGEELSLLSFFPIPFPKLELVSPSSLWWRFLLFFSRTWRLSLLRETEMSLGGFPWWLLIAPLASTMRLLSRYSPWSFLWAPDVVPGDDTWTGVWSPVCLCLLGLSHFHSGLSASPQKFLAGSFFRLK